MIKMDHHRVHRKKILTHVRHRSPTSLGQKKRKAFQSSCLSQFDLLGLNKKRGTMHLIFHLNETID